MTRWPLLLLVLLACAVGLAACGGDDSSGSSDSADKILADTFGEKDKEVESGRLGVNVAINTKGIPNLTQPVALRLTGPFESTKPNELPKFALTAEIEANGQSFSGGAIATEDKGYLTFMGQNYELGQELFDQFRKGYAEQAKCNTEQGDNTTLGALGVDPRRWLKDVEKVGGEDVGGAKTTHLRAGVDVPKMLEDVNRVLGRTGTSSNPCIEEGSQPEQAPRQLTDAERKQITEAVKSARVDLWSGDEDRILRRLNVELKLADEKRSGDIKFDLTIGNINEEQSIEAPKDARPLEELQQSLGGALPGLGGAGGGTGGTTAPPPEAGGGASSEYLQCVQEAGQDIAKLQGCAELVGQ